MFASKKGNMVQVTGDCIYNKYLSYFEKYVLIDK